MKKIAFLFAMIVVIVASSFVWSGSTNETDKGLTLEEYNQKINNKEKVVLVYFNADWCVPCIKLKPIIEQISTEQKAIVEILNVNVDDNPLIATHFEINTLPMFYLYRNGKLTWQHTGIQSKKELTDKIELYKY